MPRMQMDALFTIVGRTLAIAALSLLSACIETNVNVTCPPNGAGPGDPGPGISCGGSNKMTVAAGTPVAANAIPINPTGGSVPAGSTCSSKAGSPQSYQCKAATVGVGCGLTPGTTKCKDTYDMTSTACDCQCR